MSQSLIIAVAVGVGVLAIGVLMQTWRKVRRLRQEEQLVMSRARQKAMHIVSQARNQALEILSSAKISANTDNSRLKEEIDKISANQLREFHRILENVSKSIEEDATKEINNFKKAMELETVQSQRIVAEKIKEGYGQVQKELDVFKAERMAEIEQEAKRLTLEIVKKLINKVISIEDHQELVMRALREAKRNHVI